jgi:uncharacterized repeat protein (TIGR02543 family)
MKKFLLLMMAMFMAFAMISCGGGGDDPPPPPPPPTYVTISFDLNWPSPNSYDASATVPANPANVSTVLGGNAVGAPNPTPDQSPLGWVFAGWFDADDADPEDDDAVNLASPFYADATLYAGWTDEGIVTITKDPNWASITTLYDSDAVEPPATEVKVTKGAGLTTAQKTALAGDPSSAQTPVGFEFVGWFDADDADPDTDTEYVVESSYNSDTTIYAVWDDVGAITINKDLNWPEDGDSSGVAFDPILVTKGAALTAANLAAPTGDQIPDDYVFAGWYDSDDTDTGIKVNPATFDTDVTYDLTIYAWWLPSTIEDPVFVGWGDLGSAGSASEFTFKRTEYGCCITYMIPEDYRSANITKMTVYYTLEQTDGDDDLMKLIFSPRAKDAWSQTPNDSYSENHDNDGDFSKELDFTKYTAGGSLTILHNDRDWDLEGGPAYDIEFKVTFTSIVFE